MLAGVNGELTVERAADFHRVEENATANFFERNQPLALQFPEVTQAGTGRFVWEEDAQAGFRPEETGKECVGNSTRGEFILSLRNL
jgi:hypothetical protein